MWVRICCPTLQSQWRIISGRLPHRGTLASRFLFGHDSLVLQSPGGSAHDWLRALMTAKTAFLPVAIIAPIVIASIMHYFVKRSALGVLLRGVGGNEQAD